MNNRTPMKTRTSTGFSLVELAATLAIGALIMAVAVPSYKTSASNNQLVLQVNTLNSVLQYARGNAIKEKLPVTVCASEDQATCSGNNEWETGWIVYITDSANNDTLLKVGESATAETTIRASNFNDNTQLAFDATGILTNNESRGTFTVCDERGDIKARALILNAVGRTQKSYDQTDDNIVEDDTGANVTCTL